MDYRTRWSLWMVVAGAAIAVFVFVLTGSVVWAVVGLLGSGFVLNSIAQYVTNGRTGSRRQRSGHTGS